MEVSHDGGRQQEGKDNRDAELHGGASFGGGTGKKAQGEQAGDCAGYCAFACL